MNPTTEISGSAPTKPDPEQAKRRIKGELIRRRQLIEKYKRNVRLVSALLVIVCLAVAGNILFINRSPNPIPKNISTAVQFPIFYPEPSKQILIKQASFKYDKSLGQVSFIVNFMNDSITFAEQGSPDSFSATPNFYSTFVQKLNDYATFSGVDGRVDLTLPSETHEQTAVMNAKGTLLFASTPSKISETNWKLLFNTFNNTQP